MINNLESAADEINHDMALGEKAVMEDDQEELIDKLDSVADGIIQDMALAEKALKVRTI
jgi:hypothetical protein